MSDKPKIHFDLPTGVQATDITQVFTSKPYPVIVIDAMTSRTRPTHMTTGVSSAEAFAPTTVLAAFERQEVLRSTSALPEAMETTTVLTSLELIDASIPSVGTNTAEAMETTTVLTGVTLDSSGVVANTVQPEAMQPTTVLTGVTLN